MAITKTGPVTPIVDIYLDETGTVGAIATNVADVEIRVIGLADYTENGGADGFDPSAVARFEDVHFLEDNVRSGTTALEEAQARTAFAHNYMTKVMAAAEALASEA